MTKREIEKLKKVLGHVKLENCSFDCVIGDNNIKIEKGKVTDFIKERTRLFRETWIIPVLENIIEKYERRKI